MHKNTILHLTFWLVLIGTGLHVLANSLYLYWTYWWFDILVHSLIAFTGGLGIFWGLFDFGLIFSSRPKTFARAFWIVFPLVLFVGLGWEVFEYTNGITDSYESSYLLDTLTDIACDIFGAIAAPWIAWHGFSKKHG